MWNADTVNKLSRWLLEKAINEEFAFELYSLNHSVVMYCPITLSKDKISWLERKRNTVLRFQISTYDVMIKNNHNESEFYRKYGLNPIAYTITPGSIPIKNKNNILCGVITIAGKAPEVDHEIALEVKKYFEGLQ